jgi:Na+/H+ antiporter NhaD/arsenite permease-like protein
MISVEALVLLIFALTYLAIIFENMLVHRVATVLFAGSLLIFFGILEPREAWNYIDYNTLALLFGMMLIVNILERSGFFEYLSLRALLFTDFKPEKFFVVFFVMTGVLSAFLDNVTTVLFITPIIIKVTKKMGVHPILYLVSVIIASNIGGASTLIGDPPNLIIGSVAQKSFLDFVINVGPYVSASFVLGLGIMYVYMRALGAFRTDVGPDAIIEETMAALESGIIIKDRDLLYKSLGVLGLTILLLIFAHDLGLESGIITFFTGSLLMVLTGLSPHKIFEDIEWTALFFFFGLFIMIGSLESVGILEDVAEGVAKAMGDDIGLGVLLIGGTSMIISGFVDNIPFTMAMAHVLLNISEQVAVSIEPLWWALSIGACLGGNVTILGAAANIVVREMAEKDGIHISFMDFVKYGTPVGFITGAFGLALFYVFGV